MHETEFPGPASTLTERVAGIALLVIISGAAYGLYALLNWAYLLGVK